VLLIPHRTSESSIHGIGLFAAQSIESGTILWRFDPAVDERRLLATFGERDVLEALHYGYINPAKPQWLVICGDDARFWNFPRPGEAANAHLGSESQCGESVVVASRAIEAGEELLIEPGSDADYFRKMGKTSIPAELLFNLHSVDTN
jgi:SET domain-containing protein